MTREQGIRVLLTIVLFFLLFGLDVYGMYRGFTSRQVGANDFYPRWRAAQLFWKEGVDPYSEQATLAIQQGIRNRPSLAEEDQLAFAYPFYTVFLLWPLINIPYRLVQAIWMVIIQFSLLGGILLYLRTIRWRLAPSTLALTMIWAILVYHSLRTILLGQFAGIVFLAIAGTLWAISKKREGLAGSLLVLSTLKPQMSILLIPALLLWALGQRRWRFIGSFLLVLGLLFGLSWFALPSWIFSFIEQVLHYPSYTDYGNPLWIITHLYLPVLSPAEIFIILILTLYLFWEWRRLPYLTISSAEFHWVIGLTLIVTNLVVPRTATTNYVMMYLPLFLTLYAFLHSYSSRKRMIWLALFYMVSLVGLWVLFLGTVKGDYEAPILYLPFPLLLFLLFSSARARIERTPVSVWS